MDSGLYDIQIKNLLGEEVAIEIFKGKYVLFVNVASECGFTKQYRNLQVLSKEYRDVLLVVGVPCNQFGKQEPGSSAEIQSFCEINFGVNFLMTEKVAVKGIDQHPLYAWLTNKQIHKVCTTCVKWNFQKYLVDKEGNLVAYFLSFTNPLSKKITKYLM